ncbi:hypothetical protein EDD16DRAFT_1704804 [Pisolithus croceorrhizus]|nr:hypothetical protein EV401DRAFT_1887908 [Pisolithus croceorrhizus]KAI6122892.1 hypothetical protein EDD16DRAFT_1704804 [Pisolithus croceorrhizus]KAI6168986.1 hypothetical protein EDD17DRAFT_1868865 [Pisolithus thermaeus]
MTITPGLYRIITRLRPDTPVGIDPHILLPVKPVVVAIPRFSPEGTTWQVSEEDGQLYLLLVHTARTRPEDDRVYAYYSEPGERWNIEGNPGPGGYCTVSRDGIFWYLPNAEDLTQVVLRPMGTFPDEGYYFNFERLLVE